MGLGLMMQVIWMLMNLCTIALVLTLPGSSGSILQPPAVSPSLPFFSRGQSTSSQPEHALAAAVPAQLHHNSAPPLIAETPHDEQPHVSDAEPPLASSLPPATFPSHDSALTPSLNAPPVMKPPEAIAPLPNAHSPPFLPLPPLPPPSKAPPVSPSPPLATLPNASPPLTSLAYPPDFVAHSHAFVPHPLMAPLPHKHPPSIPYPSSNASSPLPQMFPPSPSPPNFTQPSHAFAPPPLIVTFPPEPPPIFPSPAQAMPPYPPTLHPPPIQPDASSPQAQMVPSHPSPPYFIASHDLVPPPLMEPLPVDRSPIISSPPQAGPPYPPTLHPPPIRPNASSLPPQMVYPHPSPPDFIMPPHALATPPLMEPLPAEPPSILPSPSQAVPPYPPTLQSPPISPNASSPPPQVVPSHPSPPNITVPSHALVPPTLMEPFPAEPPPVYASPPQAVPPYPPTLSSPPPQMVFSHPSPPNYTVPAHALVPPPMMEPLPAEPMFASPPQAVPLYPPTLSSPPPQMVSSHPSPPNYTVPSHALVPPPLMGPLSPEPPSVFPSLPPNASSSQPQPAPNHPSPPNFIAPSHELVPPPSMEPLPPNPPPIFLSPPPTVPPHASPPLAQWVSPHNLAPPPSITPFPKRPSPILPSVPPTMLSSPSPYMVPPQASPPTFSTPPPFTRPPRAFSTPPSMELPHILPPPPTTLPGGMPPRTSSTPAMSTPLAPAPLVMPSPPYENSHSYAPRSPPHASQRKETQSEAPPAVPPSVEPSPSSRISPRSAPSVHQLPRSHPPISHQIEAPNHDAPVWRSNASEPYLPPLSSPAPSDDTISARVPIAAPPANISSHHGSITSIAPASFSSQVHSPSVGSHFSPRPSPVEEVSPSISPPTHSLTGPSNLPPMPAELSPQSSTSEGSQSSAVSPSPSIHEHPRDEGRILSPTSVLVSPPVPSQQDQSDSPSPLYAPKPSPVAGQKYNPSSPSQGSPVALVPAPSPSAVPDMFPVPSEIPLLSPKISPSGSSTRNTKRQLSPPIRALPPPPPNQDCAYLTCSEPFTNTPPGSPCGCVWPMQVGLRLSVPLYTFFPLVSELAEEIASGVFMKQSQVRVMGANAAGEEPEKTIVLIDLVPLNDKFDNITTMLTFQRFWHKQVAIDKSIFGDYDVLYVHYPGLPPSPPMAPSDIAVISGMPYSLRDPNGNELHPLGVDVPKQRNKHKLTGSLIAVIVFSAIVGLLICGLVAWVLIFRHKSRDTQSRQTPRAIPSLARSSGPTGHSNGSGPSSPLSFGSSLAAYTGSAKTFSASEIEKATDNFNPSGILGEGGFGCVYHGILEDGSSVAVKVLKRDDQQGGREFLAEVEMLSRLHHRNLIKLIGICIDERMRCLVYELVPNGSVDSHLHGPDKETAPLDWASRLKIALGAARGLAYLHEDSSPRVIHRDFKSSNILLENDFTPKVSDFGLARAALDEENRHISTRVMGTFGYVAPEYAMTGHLLVKSDVYSYGVVLLELLTGRKPVDMSQPPGQENLVTWTRPFLTTKEGLESIIDPTLGPDVPLDNVAKVGAIASMCVQPEVSHRPFMGEVVQALKLVCNECDYNSKDGDQGSRSLSRENLSVDFDAMLGPGPLTGEALGPLQAQHDPRGHDDLEKGLSVSEIFGVNREASGSLRRNSASGPARTPKGTPRFWQRIRRLSQGSASEHGVMYRSWARSQ